ncbi:MAG: HAD-IG family 5'-nucleotidase [Deltaproteobacteria bacterium]|nr:HAD-IG family 5'-nucleotidase [Deltaproteobacteria bacterium]
MSSSPSPMPAATEPGAAHDLLADARLQELLSPAGRREVLRARQVFVNRNLRLSSVELVGFDMDYTLAVYRKRSIEQLSFDMTLDRMIRKHGHPESIRTIAYDHAFVMRGLALDRATGNLLKMDRFRHVGRAYHGRAHLAPEEKRRLYRGEKIDLKSERFAWIDSLFALPEACLYAEVVEHLEAQGQKIDYDSLYSDIRECIDEVHRDDSLKSVIRQDLARFVVPDPELGPALHKLRSGGKKLFLLTNSAWDYTDLVMRFLLDGCLPEYPSWRHYFDVVVCSAQKPSFFSDGRPLVELDTATGQPVGEARSLERGKAYASGNLADFERLVGIAGEKVLYVGDHIYGDILRSKKSSLWRTCMIIEELEDEIAYTDRCASEIARLSGLEALRARLDDEVNTRKLALNALERRLEKDALSEDVRRHVEEMRKREKGELERLRRALKESGEEAESLEQRVETGFNPYWGLLFKEGTENSRFGEQVEQYACIYTSRVSNLLAYSPMQYFRSPRGFMPHERLSVPGGKGAPGLLSPLGSEGPPKGSSSS